MSVVFHKRQKELFQSSVKNGSLSHAYIVEGQSGIGKKTFALFAAKTILCTSEKNKPCGNCGSCKKIDKLIHPDLHMISASESGAFKVESIRELIKTVYYLPNEGEKKVYILDMAHKMTPAAQNALLKVFEEPPSSAVFFILTEKRDALLPTVLSRGQMISLLPPENGEVMMFLREKYPKKSDEELRAAAETAGNIPGAAALNTDKASAAERERALQFAKLVFSEKKDEFSVYTFLLPTRSKRESVLIFIDSLLVILKELLVFKLTGGGNVIIDHKTANELSSAYSAKKLSRMIESTLELYINIENNGNLTSCIAEYCTEITETAKQS